MRTNSLLIRVGVVPGNKSSYNIALLGISLAVGRLTLDQLGQVRILDPQPYLAKNKEPPAVSSAFENSRSQGCNTKRN